MITEICENVGEIRELRNIYGERYFCRESFGSTMGTKFSALKIWKDYGDADDEEYAWEHINALNGSQPNVWEPYKIRGNAVQTCEGHTYGGGHWINYVFS